MAVKWDRESFEQIFSDAHVFDVDLSNWDKRISLSVVADHVPPTAEGRSCLFVVDFVRASKFHVTLNHLDVELEQPDHHFQWNIDDFTVDELRQGLVIALYDGKTQPRVDIECEAIEIRQLSNAIVDELFPGWNRPYSGLARPGIEGLVKFARGRRNG